MLRNSRQSFASYPGVSSGAGAGCLQTLLLLRGVPRVAGTGRRGILGFIVVGLTLCTGITGALWGQDLS
jgi:hypothetical protein